LEQNKDGSKCISSILDYNPYKMPIPEFYEITFVSGTTIEEAFNEIQK
jgi:hypothetical protein